VSLLLLSLVKYRMERPSAPGAVRPGPTTCSARPTNARSGARRIGVAKWPAR